MKTRTTESQVSHWQPLIASSYAQIPPKLHGWLIDTGSLTAKLRDVCGEVAVHLIQQEERLVRPREMTLLELKTSDQVIDREVLLFCDNQAVVYARSLIPVKAVSDRFEDLDKMGEKPLGEKIFSDPQLARSPIEWSSLSPGHYLYPHAILYEEKPPQKIFGRRSLFYGAAKPIMISEFFLPAITQLI